MSRHEDDAPNYETETSVSWTHSVSGQESVVIAISNLSRWTEVKEYAERRGLPLPAAVTELINKGLSHADPDPKLLCW